MGAGHFRRPGVLLMYFQVTRRGFPIRSSRHATSVIARNERLPSFRETNIFPHCGERSDEAISRSPTDGDCFASLAMTGAAWPSDGDGVPSDGGGVAEWRGWRAE
jgi:hypothetical protein